MNAVNRRNKAIALGISIALILALITISYAYFTGSFKGSETEIASTSGSLELTYTDCVDANDCADISASLSPGDSVTKTFQIENTGTLETTYDLYFTTLQNTFLNDELVYTLTNDTTGETIAYLTPVTYSKGLETNIEIATDISIEEGEIQKYTLTITFLSVDDDQSDNEDAIFHLTIGLQETKITLSEYVISLADTETTPDFSTTATTDEGVFAMKDDYGTSYYFRGAVENNYVYFAGFYWRIVRVNGDGTVRIIYDGKTSAYENGTSSTDRYIDTSDYNSSKTGNAYVGYMYGIPLSSTSYDEEHANTNDSAIKVVLDTWYKSNLKGTTYESYLADEIFCNDRSLYSGDGYSTSYYTNYSAYNRLDTNKSPQLTCNQQHDAFTVSDTTYGNGDLTYPIGLITADEVALAGSVVNKSNTDFYLHIGYDYWTMSPNDAIFMNGFYTYVYHVNSSGSLYFYLVTNSFGVRPVINLKADVLISEGDGTMNSPFTVELAS